MTLNPDVLATRYASNQMQEIWSLNNKIIAERNLWILVLKTQKELGLNINEQAIDAYEKVVNEVNLDSIRKREEKTRHDVKARIEEFNALAGFEEIHKGLTSRDITENIEQLQIKKSLELVQFKTVAVLAILSKLATEYSELAIAGRSHNVAAQTTTLGKRFASVIEELLISFEKLNHFLSSYPLRGFKGPVGTSQDLLDLFEQNESKVNSFEEKIAKTLGFEKVLNSVGQIYPRSLDFDAISTLYSLSSPLSSLAISIRLMAGNDLVTEGFKEGQVGSSAMPHKMNTRSCERINGLHSVLKGFLSMASDISGQQWNEGDVSCSVVRRVSLPGAFYAIDGLLETTLTVLNEFGVFKGAIKKELEKYLPFLATSKILMAAVKKGVGREKAHELIKKHSTAAAFALREGKSFDLLEDLANEKELNLSKNEMEQILKDELKFVGNAKNQVAEVVKKVEKIAKNFPEATKYKPHNIL
ncbi:MAG: adenylosuccinate lyase [Candidatus Nanopelagicales bacterium]